MHANCAHCHNPKGTARPDTDMNLRLSQRRAEAVRDFLVSQGVPAESLTAVGYGIAQPVASAHGDTIGGYTLARAPREITLRDIVFKIGGGIPKGGKFKAVQTGGPSGGCRRLFFRG